MFKLSSESHFEIGVTPERDLLISMIKRSIDDLCGNDKYLFDAAARWIFAEEKAPYPAWSFGWVCEYLTYFDKDLDLAGVIRDHLNEYNFVSLKEAA